MAPSKKVTVLSSPEPVTVLPYLGSRACADVIEAGQGGHPRLPGPAQCGHRHSYQRGPERTKGPGVGGGDVTTGAKAWLVALRREAVCCPVDFSPARCILDIDPQNYR